MKKSAARGERHKDGCWTGPQALGAGQLLVDLYKQATIVFFSS